MLTCEICGEETMLEEDMKTHLYLSHLENDMQCPLCSLSGVSYDELYFHVSTTHPEKQYKDQTDFKPTSGYSAGLNTGEKPQTAPKPLSSPPCSARGSCDKAPSGASSADPVQSKQNGTPETTLTKQSTKTRPESARHCNEDKQEMRSEHPKAKQTRLSSPRKDKLLCCPICALACSSAFILQEHIELHLQEQQPAEGHSL